MKTIIKVQDLVGGYGDRIILNRISFAVNRGEILVVLGSSGCGKTTLLKLLLGLLKPISGSIFFWGKDSTRMDEEEFNRLRRKIGLAFQSGALFNSLTAARNVRLPLEELTHLDEEMKDILVRMKLNLVGLGNYGYLMPAELSGGMKKRVGFARAIALDPRIIFFDEPSAGLDPIMAAGLDQLILKIRRLLGITMVVVSHELASIRTLADRILMLDQGRLIFEGTLAEADGSSLPRLRQFFERKGDEVIQADDIRNSPAI